MALSDSRPTRRLCDGGAASPQSRRVSPDDPHHPSTVPCPGPRRIEAGACVDCFPAHTAFPVSQAGRHPHLHFRDAMGRTVARCHHRRWKQRDGASHGTAARRSKPVPHSPGARQHDHCRHRDESSELARRRHGSRDRAPSAEEARTKRGGSAPFVDALARRGNPEWPHDHAHRRRVRGGPRRVLAGALAPGPRYRSLRHPPDERGCLARASPGQNRSPRYGIAQTCLHRLAARRTRSLPHGGHSDAGGGGCQAPNREREALVRERTRLVNRMKGCLVRFGVRTFKPTLRNAPDRLSMLRTPGGGPSPPNTLLELRRDMARLRFVMDQIKEVEAARAQGLEQAPQDKPHVMVHLLARVIGIGVETADMLVHEVLARTLRDRRAVARYAGLTGSPDESGSRRREKGLAKAGNARVRRGMIQLAWRFLLFQKESALAQWYRARTADARGGTRKTLIVALARKLLIAL